MSLPHRPNPNSCRPNPTPPCPKTRFFRTATVRERANSIRPKTVFFRAATVRERASTHPATHPAQPNRNRQKAGPQ